MADLPRRWQGQILMSGAARVGSWIISPSEGSLSLKSFQVLSNPAHSFEFNIP
jgi:hypothetical protein